MALRQSNIDALSIGIVRCSEHPGNQRRERKQKPNRVQMPQMITMYAVCSTNKYQGEQVRYPRSGLSAVCVTGSSAGLQPTAESRRRGTRDAGLARCWITGKGVLSCPQEVAAVTFEGREIFRPTPLREST